VFWVDLVVDLPRLVAREDMATFPKGANGVSTAPVGDSRCAKPTGANGAATAHVGYESS
jgi:hypothetical protein